MVQPERSVGELGSGDPVFVEVDRRPHGLSLHRIPGQSFWIDDILVELAFVWKKNPVSVVDKRFTFEFGMTVSLPKGVAINQVLELGKTYQLMDMPIFLSYQTKGWGFKAVVEAPPDVRIKRSELAPKSSE